MAYKLKLRHNVTGKTLKFNLKYNDPDYPDLPVIPIDLKSRYNYYSLADWSGVSGDLDASKIKIQEASVSVENTTYKVRSLKIKTNDGGGDDTTQSERNLVVAQNLIGGRIYTLGEIISFNPVWETFSEFDASTFTFTCPTPLFISVVNTGITPESWETFYKSKLIIPLKECSAKFNYNWRGVSVDGENGHQDVQVTDPEPIDYDVQDGDLRIYEDGWYRLVSNNSTPQPLVSWNFNLKDTSFKLSMDMYKSSGAYTTITTKNYQFSNDSETISEDGNTVMRKYVTIPGSDFAYPGKHKLNIILDNGIKGYILLNVTDRNFTVSFNTSEIQVDRSDVTSFKVQLDNNYNGCNIINYVNTPTGNKIPFDVTYLYPYLNTFQKDSTDRAISEYSGNFAYLNSNTRMFIGEYCLWNKDATDTVYLKYGYMGNTGFDGYDFTGQSLVIRGVDSDPDNIVLRNVTDEGFNHKFNVGQTYTIRDLCKFQPDDAKWGQLRLSDVEISCDTANKVSITKKSNPSNWNDFYDNFIDVKILASGIITIKFKWNYSGSAEGQNFLTITINAVTDGTGKQGR